MKITNSHPVPANLYMPVFVHVGIALTVLLVYGQLLTIGHRFPEYAYFYNFNQGFGLKDWITAYNPFRPGWYRPTAFNLYFQGITPWVGWHNFEAFQWLAFLTQFLLGSATWFADRMAFKFVGFSAFLAAIFVSIHPVFNMLLVDLVNFDALYQIFILWAIALWFSRRGISRTRTVLILVLSFLALTAKEQAVALSFFLLSTLWIFRLDERPVPSAQWMRRGLCVLLVSVFSLIIVWTRMGYAGDSTDGTYRTGLDLEIIWDNLIAGSTWIFHLFFLNAPTWGDVRELLFHPTGLVIGILFVMAAGVTGAHAIVDRSERGRFFLILFLMAAFMVLPVYSGGRPWHFGLPAIGAMLLAARGFSLLFDRLSLSPVLRMTLTGLFLLVLVGSSGYEVRMDQSRREGTSRILREALESPPRSSEQVPAGSHILYSTGGSDGLWAFGGGTLFRYVYLRSDITEQVVSSIGEMDSEELRSLGKHDNLLVYQYNPSAKPAWTDITDQTLDLIQGIRDDNFPAPQSIDLSDPFLSQFFLEGDWSAAEPWGRWTDGLEASVTMAAPAADAKTTTLFVRMTAFLSEVHPVLRVDVFLDGTLIDEWTLNWPEDRPTQVREINLPEEDYKEDRIKLTFRMDNPMSPVDLGLSVNDHRRLGIGVERIWLESPGD